MRFCGLDVLMWCIVLQDEVGCPPRIAVAEENGQVIAVRFFMGDEEWESEGLEEGLEGDDEEEDEE